MSTISSSSDLKTQWIRCAQSKTAEGNPYTLVQQRLGRNGGGALSKTTNKVIIFFMLYMVGFTLVGAALGAYVGVVGARVGDGFVADAVNIVLTRMRWGAVIGLIIGIAIAYVRRKRALNAEIKDLGTSEELEDLKKEDEAFSKRIAAEKLTEPQIQQRLLPPISPPLPESAPKTIQMPPMPSDYKPEPRRSKHHTRIHITSKKAPASS